MSNEFIAAITKLAMNELSNNKPLSDIERSYIEVLQSGDSERGKELAMNLCRSNNCSRDQASNMAAQFFRQKFGM